MTDILLLGSFHFMESKKDFSSPETQRELDALADSLLRFSPDAVCIEAPPHQQAVIDEAYQKFDLRDLHDPYKMKNETLGEIRVFGEVHPIRYNNESIQIGFRMGKLQNLPKVYAIDDDSELDDEVFENPSPALKEAMKNASSGYAGSQKAETLADTYRRLNGTEWSRLNHIVYLRANATGNSENYLGVKPVAQWYERNLKIFSNIQRLAERYERIFIVYGAGHLQILRDLIRADDRLHLVDTMSYLPNSPSAI